MADRVLYWGSGSPPCWRVQVTLEEKNLPYESKMLSFSDAGHKSPEVVAINPRGQFPTFKDGDAIVNESVAIMQYLDSVYPEPALMPTEKVAKAKAFQRLHEAPILNDKIRDCVRAKMFLKDDEAFAKGLESLKEELPRWEGYVADTDYLAGAEVSLADFVLGTTLLFLQRQGATFGDYPKLKAYVKRMEVHRALQWWRLGRPFSRIVWDHSGQDKILVIDSNNRACVGEARNEVHRMLEVGLDRPVLERVQMILAPESGEPEPSVVQVDSFTGRAFVIDPTTGDRVFVRVIVDQGAPTG